MAFCGFYFLQRIGMLLDHSIPLEDIELIMFPIKSQNIKLKDHVDGDSMQNTSENNTVKQENVSINGRTPGLKGSNTTRKQVVDIA